MDAANKSDFMGRQPRRLTWSELEVAVDGCASASFEHGIRSGDVVGIQVPNSVELVVVYLALNRLGAILSPYPMPYQQHELTQLGRIAGVSALVTTAVFGQRDLPGAAAEVIARLGRPVRLLVWWADPEGVDAVLDLDEVSATRPTAAYVDHLAGLRPHPNDCVIIIFTSGTTGEPKGVPRAHGDSLVSAGTTSALPRLTADDVILNPMLMVNAGAIAGMFLP